MTLPSDAIEARPSDSELADALFPQLQRRFQATPVRETLRRSPFAYSTSSAIEVISVAFEDQADRDLLFKDLSWHSLLPAARDVRPRFFYRPGIEIAAYAHVLPQQVLGTPEYYGSAVDEPKGRYWLFIEKVEGHPLCDDGDFEMWLRAARWLARLHTLEVPFGFRRATYIAAESMHTYDLSFFRQFIDHSRQHLESKRTTCDSDLPRLERLYSLYERAITRLVAADPVLVHGEYYASNILVRDPPANDPICPIDWGTVGVGPAGTDLAALTSGSWPDDARTRMVAAYFDALPQPDARVANFEELLLEVEYCRLHIAVQWAFWASKWEAPENQRHDWVGEGLDVARRLGL